jgi:hypothetical protein
MTLVHNAGFPHSEIPGSQPAHGSPRLIAVFHVLHRHLAPRHPPYALSSLTQRDAEKLTFFHFSLSAIRLLRCFQLAGRLPRRRLDRPGRPPSFLGRPPHRSNSIYALRPGTPAGPYWTSLDVLDICYSVRLLVTGSQSCPLGPMLRWR